MTDRALPMFYGESPPADDLAPWVVAYWRFTVEPGVGEIEHVVPLDGSVSLVVHVNRPELRVVGPTARPITTTVRGGDLVYGARLWPGVASCLLSMPVSALADRVVSASDSGLLPWARTLAADLVAADDGDGALEVWNRALRELLPPSRPLDTVVMSAVLMIIAAGGDLSIGGLARSVGLSPRQLRRRFRAAVGLSPKEFARVRRFRRSLVGALDDEERRWAELAATFGFADQMHLIREYRRATGHTPQALVGYLDGIEHGEVVDR